MNDANGALTGEAKQEEALSSLPDVPVPGEAKTEGCGQGRAEECGHANGEQPYEIQDTLPELVCTGAAMDIAWCFGCAV